VGFFCNKMPDSNDRAVKDENYVPVLTGVSSQDITIGDKVFVQDETPVPIAVNPATGAVILEPA